MKVVRINRLEEILELKSYNGKIEVSADEVVKYIYVNKNKSNSRINIDELRGVYVKSIKKSYEKKNYEDKIMINPIERKKMCYY